MTQEVAHSVRSRRPWWYHRSFAWYWSSIAVSGTGDAVSTLVVPIVAAVELQASPGQMSVLVAVGMLPSLLLQVVVATWSDRTRHRVLLMVGADIVSGLLIGLVPFLWWRSGLTFPVLVLVMTAKAVSGVGRSAFASPLVVDLLDAEDIVGGTGRINGTMSATDIVGQALGGGLLSVLSAPVVLLVDAVSFLVSAGFTSRIRLRGQSTDSAVPLPGPLSGLALFRLGRALLVRVDFVAVLAIAAANGVTQTMFVIYCTRSLQVAPALLGPLLAVGAIGGVAGGLLAGRIDRSSHQAAVLFGLFATLWSLVPLPLAHAGVTAVLAVVNFELAGAFGGTVIIAATFGAVQNSAPPGTVARTMAIATNGLQAAALIGATLGGIIGEDTGTKTVLIVAIALMAAACTVTMGVLTMAPGHHRHTQT